MSQVAKALGVRYLLEGSVRKSGERVRINAQLIDSSGGGHLWADRYDGTVHDVFELQDEVGAQVVAALSVKLGPGEREKLQKVHTHNLDAYELYVQAKATPYPPIPERIAAAREMFEEVIGLDPDFAGGYAGVSSMLGFGALWAHGDMSEVLERAAELARKAIALDETFAWSHTALGLVLIQQGRYDDAIAAARFAIELQPSDADGYAYLGLIAALAGNHEEGAAYLEQALRLNPRFIAGPYLNMLGMCRALAGDYEAAVEAFESNLRREGPVGPPAYCALAAAYEALGRCGEAMDIVARMRKSHPAFRMAGWNFLKLIRPPATRARFQELLLAVVVPAHLAEGTR